MTQQLTYYTLDVFTTEPFGGNQLAVIPDAPDLPDERMQAIAGEFNYPETVFVRPAEDPQALCKLRIFTPQSELPFAGHPTIGTAQLLTELHLAPAPVEGYSRFFLEEGIGLVPVSVCREDSGQFFTWLTTATLPTAGGAAPATEALAVMLGLTPGQIGIDGMPPAQTGSAGVPMTFIPLRDRDALRHCQLDRDHWRSTLASTEAPQVYVFCPGERNSGIDFHVRMFAPALGVPEDPATGAAAAAFAGYLWSAHGRKSQWLIAQGEDMRRPSRIHLDIEGADGQLESVRVGGSAVRVCEGQMRLPE